MLTLLINIKYLDAFANGNYIWQLSQANQMRLLIPGTPGNYKSHQLATPPV
jgi:hypothetical protein